MCPNCVINTMGLGAGYFFAFLVCAVFFIVGVGWIIWGFKTGQFKDVEESKYSVIEDDDIIM